MPDTMERTSVAINGDSHALAQSEDIGDLKRRIIETIRAGGGFVEMTLAGDRSTSVLFTACTSVTISTRTVEFDDRDDGNAATPFELAIDGTADYDV